MVIALGMAMLDALHHLVDFPEVASEFFCVFLFAVSFGEFDLLTEVIGLLFKLVVLVLGVIALVLCVMVAVAFAVVLASGVFTFPVPVAAFRAFTVAFAFAVTGHQVEGGCQCGEHQGGYPDFHVGALSLRVFGSWGLGGEDVRVEGLGQ